MTDLMVKDNTLASEAAIAANLSAEIQVQPLEWIVRGLGKNTPAVYAAAFGISRFYSIAGSEGDWTLSYPGADCMRNIGGFKTQHLARTAAQADYETRSRSAVKLAQEPSPKLEITRPQTVRQYVEAMAAQGVQLPLTATEDSAIDATGKDVFTVDVNGERPDAQVAWITGLIVVAINTCGGYKASLEKAE